MDKPLTGIRRLRQRRQITGATISTLSFVAEIATSQRSVSAKINVLDAARLMVHDFPQGPTRHVALKILNFHLDRLFFGQEPEHVF